MELKRKWTWSEPAAGNDEETYAKQQLGGDSTETTMLGLKYMEQIDGHSDHYILANRWQ
jgi:hypothetical protein